MVNDAVLGLPATTVIASNCPIYTLHLSMCKLLSILAAALIAHSAKHT
jgi:hypothetical protein